MSRISEWKDLKSETRTVLGKDVRAQYQVSKSGRFRVNLPGFIEETLGPKWQSEFATLAATEEAAKQALQAYITAARIDKKVIRFAFEGSGQIVRDGKCVWNENDLHFADGLAVSLVAAVYIEQTYTLTDGSTRINYERQESSIPESIQPERFGSMRLSGFEKRPDGVVEWTQAYEDFFAALGRAMEDMILKLMKFKEPKLLAAAVKNQLRLGAGPLEPVIPTKQKRGR